MTVLSRPLAKREAAEAGAWSVGVVVAAALMVLLLIAARWWTRSRFLFDWDAVNYALALQHYDMRLGQPHSPGYFLYVLLVRGVWAIVGEANLALVLVSAVFGLLLPGAVYLLGRDLLGHRAGLAAAALSLTGPTFWFQSSVASSRIIEGFFVALIGWLCVRIRWRGDPWAFWALPVTLAVAAGFRQQAVLFILPLCLYATWRIPLWKRAAAAALLLGGVLAWATPMLAQSGGWATYRQLNAAQWQGFIVNGTGVFYAGTLRDALWRAYVNNISLFIFTSYVCILGIPLCAYVVGQWWQVRRERRPDDKAVFLMLAVAPSLIFSSLVHIQQIGHAMTYAPFWVLILVAAAFFVAERGSALLIGALAVTNLLFIFLYPARLLKGRVTTPTVASVRRIDTLVGGTVAAVKAHTSPRDTVIIGSGEISRYLDYYLPHYTHMTIVGLEEPSPRVLGALMMPIPLAVPGTIDLPADVRRFVLVDYKVDVAAALQARERLEVQPLSVAAPWVLVARTRGPARIRFAPGRLEIIPASTSSAGP